MGLVLNQVEFCRPADGSAATVNHNVAVDVLGMGMVSPQQLIRRSQGLRQ
jgi:hypothetical protein